MSDSLILQRYGLSKKRRRDRVLAISAAAVALVGFLVWALWFTIANADRPSFRDVGYQIIDEYSAKLIFEVTRKPGALLTCNLKVLNQSFAIVGYKTLEIPPASSSSQVISTEINTTELGVTGLVDSCR